MLVRFSECESSPEGALPARAVYADLRPRAGLVVGEIGIDLGIAGDVERGAAGRIGEGEAALAVVELDVRGEVDVVTTP